jgi:hypothetical protein
MSNKGLATLRGPLRRARALAMLRAKLTMNLSDDKVAAHFGVSPSTVARTTKIAIREGLLQQYEDELLNDLVPTAMKAAKDALENGDTQVALEILKGSGVLKKQIDRNKSVGENDGDSLEAYIRIKRDRNGTRPSLPTDGAGTLPRIGLLEAVAGIPGGAAEDAPGLLEVDDNDSLAAIAGALTDTELDALEGELVDEEGKLTNG